MTTPPIATVYRYWDAFNLQDDLYFKLPNIPIQMKSSNCCTHTSFVNSDLTQKSKEKPTWAKQHKTSTMAAPLLAIHYSKSNYILGTPKKQ